MSLANQMSAFRSPLKKIQAAVTKNMLKQRNRSPSQDLLPFRFMLLDRSRNMIPREIPKNGKILMKRKTNPIFQAYIFALRAAI
jgi:hypothetical protein